jgi:hypothetical protein
MKFLILFVAQRCVLANPGPDVGHHQTLAFRLRPLDDRDDLGIVEDMYVVGYWCCGASSNGHDLSGDRLNIGGRCPRFDLEISEILHLVRWEGLEVGNICNGSSNTFLWSRSLARTEMHLFAIARGFVSMTTTVGL